jgi:L-amino acid N-acyltransferase YncA
MKVRLALEHEEDLIVEMARINMQTRPALTFSEARCRETFRGYIRDASPTIWVAEDKAGVVGMLVADFYLHRAANGLFTTQEVLFVKPERRGGRAAALLMKQLIDWSLELGANEIVGGNDNEFNSEQTARFLGKFGFKRVGHAMRKVL